MSTEPKKSKPSRRLIMNDRTSEACEALYRRLRKQPSRAARPDDDDGPATPRGVDKRENAVDRFSNENEENEGHEKRSSHRMRDVEQHNDTHPQLKDVLDKRRSDRRTEPEHASRRRYHRADLCPPCLRRLRDCPRAAPRVPRTSSKQRRTRTNGTRKMRRVLRRRPKTRKNVLTVYRQASFASTSSVYSMDYADRDVRELYVVESDHSKTSQTRQPSSKGSVATRASLKSVLSYRSYGSMGQPPKV